MWIDGKCVGTTATRAVVNGDNLSNLILQNASMKLDGLKNSASNVQYFEEVCEPPCESKLSIVKCYEEVYEPLCESKLSIVIQY